MLGHMSTTARGLPGGWTPPICLAWLTCVVAFAWLLGRDPHTFSEGGDDSLGTSTTIFLLVASVLGLAFGVAMVMERHTSSIFPAAMAAAGVATVATWIAALSIGQNGVDVLLICIPFAVAIGVPVAAGALLGALGRLVLRQLGRRSTRPLNVARPR
jgi:hypothetical protein